MNATTRALNPHVQLPLAGPDGAAEPSIARSNWRNTGKAFEKEIERTAGAYQSLRQATLRKVDPPVRIFWKDDPATGKKRQIVTFLRNPWMDFVGAHTAGGGRMLAVECKSTATHRLGLREGQLAPDQVAAMRVWACAGAAVCVLWQFAGRVALFTPDMLEAAIVRGDKSLVHEAGKPVPRGEGSVIWDFLPVLVAS